MPPRARARAPQCRGVTANGGRTSSRSPGSTAAIEAGFAHRDTFHLYLRAFAPEFSNLGPGNVLTEHMIGWCVDNGMKRYDMLAPRSRNKAEWQSGEVGVVDFALPMTWLGRLYAATVPTHIAPDAA